MTAEEWIKEFRAKPSIKYTDRYDVDGSVDLSFKNLTDIPIPFGVNEYFTCSHNQLTSLYNAPIEVGSFSCANSQLTTLDHLPKYIGNDLLCQGNPFQNLNGLKNVKIKGTIWFFHNRENELDYWLKALYNTDLDVLEYHYDNHEYYFINNDELERYIMNELEEIIKIKRIQLDLSNHTITL